MRLLYLNGSPCSSRIDGLDKLQLTISVNDNLVRNLSTSSELIFFDAGYQIIKTLLIDAQNPNANKIHVKIYDECCNGFFPKDFLITVQDIHYCDGDCFVTAKLRVDDQDEEILRQLRAKKINDASLFTNANLIPKFRYCIDHRHHFITHFIICVVLVLVLLNTEIIIPLLASLLIINAILIILCAAIVAIQKAFNFLADKFNDLVADINKIIKKYNKVPVLPNIGLLKWSIKPISITPPGCEKLLKDPFSISKNFIQLMGKVVDFAVSCDNRHPAPFFRYYFDIAAQISGASGWDSQQFNNPSDERYNACYLSAAVDHSELNPPTIIKKNLPDMTCARFLDNACKLNNGIWFVLNGKIQIQREDFLQNMGVFFDTILESSDIITPACYDYSPETPYASIAIRYQEDMREETGNEILDEYKTEVDYQALYGNNSGWEERNEIEIPFGAVRVRNDSLRSIFRFDPLTWWANLRFPDVLLANRLSASFRWLLLQKGVTAFPKAIIWEPASGLKDARVKEYNTGNFNKPLKLDPSTTGNLYDDYRIKDPSLLPYKRWHFTLVTKFSCDRLRDAVPLKRVILPRGTGRIERYEFDFDKLQITISGTI